MAVQFANNIDLNKLQILNFAVQRLATDPSAPVQGQVYYNTDIDRLKMYTGGTWLILEASTGSSTTIDDIVAGNQITVSITSGVATVAHGSITGASSTDFTNAKVLASLTLNNGHITGITTRDLTLANLGYTGATDADKYTSWTIGGDTGTPQAIGSGQTATIEGGDGISTAASATRKLTVNVDSTVVRTTGTQTVGGNKTFSDNVVVQGNLTVSGAVTTVLSETVNIEDNLIVLNSNATGSPTQDAGLMVNRGTSDNMAILWDEANELFVFTNVGAEDGTSANPAKGASQPIKTGRITADLATSFAAEPKVVVHTSGNAVQTRTNAEFWGDIKVAATTSATGVVELATDAETRTGTDATRAVTPAGLQSRNFKADVGNGTNSSFTVTHNLGTRDVMVQVFSNVDYDTVLCGVTRTSTNAISVDFGFVPSNNEFRVLITRI